MNQKLKIAAGIFFICASLGIFYWQMKLAQAEHVANWGIADAKEININSKVSGRVIEIFAEEGDVVKAGQILAKIDKEFQEPQQRQAEAAIAAQVAQLQQTIIATQEAEETLNAALQAAQANLARAETAVNLAAKNESRYRELLQASAISAQTYDVYRTQFEDTQAAYNAAQANVESAKASLLRNDENKALQASLRAQIAALQSQLESVEVNIKETEIFAPFDGVITAKYVEEGALISNVVPLFSLQDTGDNWVDFKIKETELKNFRIGKEIFLQGRDENLKISGTVESIRRKAEFATQKATSERGEVDIIAFNVKVRTNSAKIYPGMRFKIADENH